MESKQFSQDEELSVSVLKYFRQMMEKPEELRDQVEYRIHVFNMYLTCVYYQ